MASNTALEPAHEVTLDGKTATTSPKGMFKLPGPWHARAVAVDRGGVPATDKGFCNGMAVVVDYGVGNLF